MCAQHITHPGSFYFPLSESLDTQSSVSTTVPTAVYKKSAGGVVSEGLQSA